MTTLQVTADIYRSLGIISEDENVLRKAAKYLSRLAKQMTEDPTCITKEEYFAMLDQSEKQIAEGKGITFTDVQKMNAWLNAL